MKVDCKALRAGLRQFGLNPSDWTLVGRRRTGGLVHFEVRQRGSIFFEGWASRGRWISLGVAGTVLGK
jgi:hypothetical protein